MLLCMERRQEAITYGDMPGCTKEEVDNNRKK